MIQNDLIALISKYIQKAILNEIYAGSKLVAVIADECRDCANKEQMSLVVRFIAQSKRHLLNVNMAQVANKWLH